MPRGWDSKPVIPDLWNRIDALDQTIDEALEILRTIQVFAPRVVIAPVAAEPAILWPPEADPEPTWSLSRIAGLIGHPGPPGALQNSLTRIRLALDPIEELPHRGRALEHILIEAIAPQLPAHVWVQTYDTPTAVIHRFGIDPLALEWIQSQCDALDPVYGITSGQRVQILERMIRYEQRLLSLIDRRQS